MISKQLKSREVTWTEFCSWLIDNKKRVKKESKEDDNQYFLIFEDGTLALLESDKDGGSPGYSELTPGSEGRLTTHKVTVYDFL